MWQRWRAKSRITGRGLATIAVPVVAISGLAVAACDGDDDAAAADTDPELVVFAAASLGPAFEQYGARFDGADVKFSFAGSDDLAAQIRQGVVPDVYAAANTALPDELHEEGLVEKPQGFVTNKLVVGVPVDSEIHDLAQLEEPGLKIAVGDPEVPVGIYTREVLDALGPQAADAILDNVASEEPDVGGIVGKLTQGAVDAGFVYESDIAVTDGAVRAIEIPASAGPEITYGIAAVAEAPHRELAEKFVDEVSSGAGQDVLLQFGFGPAS